jgi:hypothetical protein
MDRSFFGLTDDFLRACDGQDALAEARHPGCLHKDAGNRHAAEWAGSGTWPSEATDSLRIGYPKVISARHEHFSIDHLGKGWEN